MKAEKDKKMLVFPHITDNNLNGMKRNSKHRISCKRCYLFAPILCSDVQKLKLFYKD